MNILDLGKKLHDPDKFHAGIISVLTIALIGVAWIQFDTSNKTSKEKFLLALDARYTSKESIRARQIIHGIYRSFGGDEVPREYKTTKTKEKIEELRTNSEIHNIEDFIYLHNFIDILETIAFFYNKGTISENDLKILSGDSIIFYYTLFSLFISNRRTNTHNSNYYKELEKCVNSLQRKSTNK